MGSTGLSSSAHDTDADAGRADVVVGLTGHNAADSIGAVVRAAGQGLTAFSGMSSRFLLADDGSTDGTRQAARAAAPPDALVELEYERGPAFSTLPYHGQPGRAAALRAVLQAARRLDANEGALTKGIVYPMFRAVYGVRLREPAASEFGCSARLAEHALDQDFWDAELAPIGIDFWLAAAAAAGDFRIGEAIFGERGIRTTAADLSTTLAQVVGALFADVERRVDVWQRVRSSAAIPVFGTPPPLE